MGQAITTMFWRLVGREAGGKPLLSDGEDTDTATLLVRYWKMGHPIIMFLRRLIFRGPPKLPPPDHPLTSPVDHNSPDYHLIDIGIDPLNFTLVDEAVNLVHLAEAEVEVPPPILDQIAIRLVDDDVVVPVTVVNILPPAPVPVVNILPPAPVPAPAQSMMRGRLGPYSWDQKILLVGEGDFSFSTSLAVAFGDASNIVSTSLDSFEFLKLNYKRALSNIMELTSKRCKVMHGVDATKMVNHPQLHSFKFDRIVYNFPHAGFSNLNDPRDAQIRMHQRLVRRFLGNAKKMIKEDGQIHITHKCVGFSLEWKLEMLGSNVGLALIEETPFNLRDYPGYCTKYGYGGDRDFDCKPSKTYKFHLLANANNKDSPSSTNKQRRKTKPIINLVPRSPSITSDPDVLSIGSSSSPPPVWGKIGPYSGDKKILVVGDGDFSFSASLAAAFGDASNLVATSLDSYEFLSGNYKGAETNILALRGRGCNVFHGVDATSMAINHPQLRSLRFNYIIFNFPKANFSIPKPPRSDQISKHQELVKGFLANAKKMIQGDDGQIHITHQCFGPYLEWNIDTLGSSEGVQLVEESPFNHREYRGYCVKFGCGGDRGFDCSPSKTYKFQLVASLKMKKKRTRGRKKTP